MTKPTQLAVRSLCPRCGATVGPDDQYCWLCGAEMSARGWLVTSSPPNALVENDRTFALSTLLLIVTLVCLCLGLCVTAPGLGIVLIVALAPALVRAWAVARRQQSSGRPLSFGEKATAVVGSLGVVLLVACSAFVAFCVTCFAACSIGLGIESSISPTSSANPLNTLFLPLSIGAASLVGIGVFIWLMRVFWPKRLQSIPPRAGTTDVSKTTPDSSEKPHDAP